MAAFLKYRKRQVENQLQHNTREKILKSRNEDIDLSRTHLNEILHPADRGRTAADAYRYFKQRMNDPALYHLNRKDLVCAFEWAITFPQDLAPEQEPAFCQEVYNFMIYFFGHGDPDWEKNVIQCIVHRDEKVYDKKSGKHIAGYNHIHWIAVPAVPNKRYGKKTKTGRSCASAAYPERVCIDDLIKLGDLKRFHPELQTWLSDRGISCTVYKGGTTSGKNLSVKELKEITKATGLTLDQVNNLAKENERLREKIASLEKENTISSGWGESSSWDSSGGWGKDKTWDIDI